MLYIQQIMDLEEELRMASSSKEQFESLRKKTTGLEHDLAEEKLKALKVRVIRLYKKYVKSSKIWIMMKENILVEQDTTTKERSHWPLPVPFLRELAMALKVINGLWSVLERLYSTLCDNTLQGY